MASPSLEYHVPPRRLPGPAVWLGIPAVVFAGASIICIVFAMRPHWLPDDVVQFMRRSIGWPQQVFGNAAVIAWLLGLLLGFAGMYLPKGNRLLPTIALLLCMLFLITGGVIATLHF